MIGFLLFTACSEYGLNNITKTNGSNESEDYFLGTDSLIEGDACDTTLLPESNAAVDESCYNETVGSWDPTIKWTNTEASDIITTPVVGDLDGDGKSEIVASNMLGETFAIHGDSGTVLWMHSPSWTGTTENEMAPAIADVNGDGEVDVVIFGREGAKALKGTTGEVLWHNSNMFVASTNCGGVGVYDLDGDGISEVVIGNVILNGSDGSLRGSGAHGRGAGLPFSSTSFGVAADVLRNGSLQVVVGNALYDADGNTIWHNGLSDGYVAVGQFDGDEEGEIVVSSKGDIRLQNHDGSVIWEQKQIMPFNSLHYTHTSGPPTIADFNNDGEPEIGVAGTNVYMVFDKEGNILWSNPTTDYSSGITGSSVFDFEGDGAAEVIYADENDVWVYDGATGAVKMQESRHSNGTCTEYPTIADIDDDGHAEIIFASMAFGGTETGITVIEDANDSWMPATKIWNQHAYSITNINEDGSVPAYPDVNWDTYNTFRSGDLVAGQNGDFPDFFGMIDDVCAECEKNKLTVYARIGNQGLMDVEGSVDVEVRMVSSIGYKTAYTQTVEGPFHSGSLSASIAMEIDTQGAEVYSLELIVDENGSPTGEYIECNEDNNQAVWTESYCE
jgi:hypothetical protein